MQLPRKSTDETSIDEISSGSEFDKDKIDERHKIEIEKFRQRRRKQKRVGSPEKKSPAMRSPEVKSLVLTEGMSRGMEPKHGLLDSMLAADLS